jgi:hypothetical protein
LQFQKFSVITTAVFAMLMGDEEGAAASEFLLPLPPELLLPPPRFLPGV